MVTVAIMVAVTIAVVVVLAEVVLDYLVSDMQIFHVPDPVVVLTFIVLVTQDADLIFVVAIIAVARGDQRCGKERRRYEQRCQQQRKKLHQLCWTPST